MNRWLAPFLWSLLLTNLTTPAISIASPTHPRTRSDQTNHSLPLDLLHNTDLDSAALDSFIVHFMNENHVPGLSACVVKNGQILWTGSYGYARLTGNIPVADSTGFMLASVSKTITGTALMQLWEDSLFGLDDNLNDYLPFQVINPRYPAVPLTFRQLLTHTSSLKDNWEVLGSVYVLGDSHIPLGSFLADYFTPGEPYYNLHENFNSWALGTAFDYCNAAVALAGYLVEVISGTRLDRYCEEHLFSPLQMPQTAWHLAGLDVANIAMPYTWTGSNYFPYGYYGYPDYPDGQLRTSATQLGHFLSSYMQWGQYGGAQILDSTTVALMTTVQFPQIEPTQGLIWYYLQLGDRLLCGHNGGDAGVSTEMYYCPAESSGVVVLCNGETVLIQLVRELFDYAETYNSQSGVTVVRRREAILNNVIISSSPSSIYSGINFEVRVPGVVTLSVYDLLGRALLLPQKTWYDVGHYRTQLETQNLPSGVYLYRLQAATDLVTGKFILLK